MYDDSHYEYPRRHDKLAESNYLKNQPLSDYKPDTKNAKDTFNDADSFSANFDNFHEDMEQEHFDLDKEKLSAEEKLDMEEYNEQMIPNPNFYKINNELHTDDEQNSKDHDTFRNELGFSPVVMNNNYPASAGDVYNPIENDYGNENQNDLQQQQDIKTKRNTRAFDQTAKQSFNYLPREPLNDQDDTGKNDLSHEADYKLSKSEQDSQNKHAEETEQNPLSDRDHGFENEQRAQNELKDKFEENQFQNENRPQNLISNQNSHTSDTGSNYSNFQDTNRNTKPIADSNKNSHSTKTGSKENFSPKKQSYDSKSLQYKSQHDKTNHLTNEINLKISNRMMSRGLGPSLPSQSAKYYSSMYRNPLNVDVENQHWKGDGRNDNRNDLTDYIGMQRRLLQFDYEEPSNELPLHESNMAPNGKNLKKTSFIETSNNQKGSKNGEISKTPLANSSERRNVEETDTMANKSTMKKLDDPKIESKSQTNRSESNNTLPVDSVKQQLDRNVSNNATTNDDHGKVVKRSATYGKPLGLRE